MVLMMMIAVASEAGLGDDATKARDCTLRFGDRTEICYWTSEAEVINHRQTVYP